MLIAVSLAVLASFDPSSLTVATLVAQQPPATQTPGTEAPAAEPAPASEPAPEGVAEGAATQTATEPAAAQAAPEAAAQTPAATVTPAAPVAETKPEVKKAEPYVPPPYRGRIRYVWPFAKEHELLPGDVRIPLPVWAMAVGGGAAVAAGVPFYTIARSVESRLVSGDDTLRTDADRAQLVRHGRTMEAWGLGLWAAGGVLVAASWTAFYVLGFQDKPKGLNYQLSVGPQGGLVQFELALP